MYSFCCDCFLYNTDIASLLLIYIFQQRKRKPNTHTHHHITTKNKNKKKCIDNILYNYFKKIIYVYTYTPKRHIIG